MFQVPSQQLWGTLTAFWKTPNNWRFYWYGSTSVLILSSRLEKTSWNENRRSCTKSEPARRTTLHQNRSHFTYIHIFFFTPANLVFKFNLALVGVLDHFCHNLFTCLPFDYHLLFFWSWGSVSVSIHFLISITKILMRLRVLLFCEIWWPQNVFIMFLFFTKNSYLLTTKITTDVTNSLWFLHAVQELGDSFRDVFGTLSNIKDGAFCESN